MMDSRGIAVSRRTLALLEKIGTPTLAGMLTHRMGYRNNYMEGILPLAVKPDQRIVGRARTLRFIPLREDLVKAQYESLSGSPHRSALEGVNPRDVLVIDAGGCTEAAVLGDMFTRRVKFRGARGIVIDGVVRDLSMIRQVGLPVFARGMHGAGIPRALMSVGLDEPVRCGDIPVVPGDIVVGDEDGVVVIPPQLAADLAKQAYEHEREEEWARMKLAEGASLHEVYPPTPEKRKEFEAWLSAHKRAAASRARPKASR